MEDRLRAFIAVDLPETVKETLFEATKSIQSRDVKIRWVKPENMHLTLKFLGDITAGQAEDIGEGLTELAAGFPSTSLEIGGLGAFPNLRKPRVIWVGVKSEQIVADLHAAIENLVVNNGIEPENRSFRLHLTIGRVKSISRGSEFQKQLENISFEPVNVPLDQVTLFKSKLTPTGPVYSRLVEAKLMGKEVFR